MKNQIRVTTIVFVLFAWIATQAQQEYSPYFKVAGINGTISEVKPGVVEALEGQGFRIIGEYSPEDSPELYVLCYTSDELEKLCSGFKDRGALASVLKVAFKQDNGMVKVSMLNPDYMFYAYLLEDIDKYESGLAGISGKAREAMKTVGGELVPFGGMQTKEDLQDYHYKIFMPYFTDPVELQEFDSFESGLEIIRNNLSEKKGNTIKVYELVYPEQEIAVFGVGLLDQEQGEAKFLPIIGEEHIAAMPYEIILQGDDLTMLHGKYRFALYWPELTMGTFVKIMSTPGDVEDMMEALSE